MQLERDEDLDSEIRLSRKQSVKLINTKISKEEFASYLKLKVDSLFVEQMFAVADADDDGSISFREFLDIIVLFSKGNLQQNDNHAEIGSFKIRCFNVSYNKQKQCLNMCFHYAERDS